MSSGDVQLKVLKHIESLEEGVPQIYGNIAVTGLSDTNADLYNGIISTQIALEVGNMQVEETGSVPSLHFNADQPTLIRCGEGVLGGGLQDRIIAESTIVEGNRSLRVFCIEAGRWASKTGEWIHTNTPVVMRRAILEGHSQQYVWSEVQKILSSWGVRSGTSALGELYIHHGFEFEKLATRFNWSDDEVGMIVTIDGRVQGVEIFGDKMGLRREYASILKESYAPIALQTAGERSTTFEDVNNGINIFLEELHSGHRKTQLVSHNGNLAYACAV
ncbi:MAG: ARPP-1 family domain-containing protein [Candidatus Thorarchaeota archaeon]